MSKSAETIDCRRPHYLPRLKNTTRHWPSLTERRRQRQPAFRTCLAGSA